MGESSSDFRDTLVKLIDASPEPMDHPPPDQWLAYQRGELPAGEEARLQEHLVRCRDCFDLAAAAAAFAQPDEAPGVGHDVREISAGPRQWLSREARVPYALAASFFVALVGLSIWSFRQQSALAAFRAPQPNAPIFEVIADERAAAERELTVPAEARMFVFHPGKELPAYRLVVRDAAGRELSSHELRPDRDFALTLYFPEGLRPGRYRMELSGGSGGGAGKVLETHLLRVTEAGRGE